MYQWEEEISNHNELNKDLDQSTEWLTFDYCYSFDHLKEFVWWETKSTSDLIISEVSSSTNPLVSPLKLIVFLLRLRHLIIEQQLDILYPFAVFLQHRWLPSQIEEENLLMWRIWLKIFLQGLISRKDNIEFPFSVDRKEKHPRIAILFLSLSRAREDRNNSSQLFSFDDLSDELPNDPAFPLRFIWKKKFSRKFTHSVKCVERDKKTKKKKKRTFAVLYSRFLLIYLIEICAIHCRLLALIELD